MTQHYRPPTVDRATELAEYLKNAAKGPGWPEMYGDGVVVARSLVRDGDRLHTMQRSDVWFDVSRSPPRTDHPDSADLPHTVVHPEPIMDFRGWHETDDGWVLLSTDGTSWTPEAFVSGGPDHGSTPECSVLGCPREATHRRTVGPETTACRPHAYGPNWERIDE